MVKKTAKDLVKKGAKELVKKTKGRGRPKGSKNKPKPAATVSARPVVVAKSRSKIRKEQIAKRKPKGLADKAKPAVAPVIAANIARQIAAALARRRAAAVAAKAALKKKKSQIAAGAATLKDVGKKYPGTTGAIVGSGILGLGGSIDKKKRLGGSGKAAKVTFGQAFKEARKKGEGTKFTFNGKQYTAVTKDDLKKKGYDANELKQYANRKGKARGPLRRAGQGIKKVLLGKDKKFGGDKGLIDFVRKPKKKVAGGMANSKPAPKKYKAGGMATKGLGKAYMKSKR